MTQCEMDNRFERQKQFMEVTEEWFKEHFAQALNDRIEKLPDGKDIKGTIAQFKVNQLEDVMTDLKSECPMRNKQGNCCPVGGFCADAVPDEICKAVRSAYERGYSDAVTNENQKAMQPVRNYDKYQDYLHHCPTCERTLPIRSQYGKVNYCHYCGQKIVFK